MATQAKLVQFELIRDYLKKATLTGLCRSVSLSRSFSRSSLYAPASWQVLRCSAAGSIRRRESSHRDRFIGVAEQEGWISELSRQLLERAFEAFASVPDHLTLAINISPIQLRDEGVADEIRYIAKAKGFSLSRLIVEITESAMIDNLETASTTVAELKAMGCKLALDDFGTGYLEPSPPAIPTL